MRINEVVGKTIDLYHGTCEQSAEQLLANGWTPNSGVQGGNMGQSKYLYLTTDPEDALWFAQEKGCDTIVKVSDVPLNMLMVDPEDGIGDNVEDELYRPGRRSPGKVVLIKPLKSNHFSLLDN